MMKIMNAMAQMEQRASEEVEETEDQTNAEDEGNE